MVQNVGRSQFDTSLYDCRVDTKVAKHTNKVTNVTCMLSSNYNVWTWTSISQTSFQSVIICLIQNIQSNRLWICVSVCRSIDLTCIMFRYPSIFWGVGYVVLCYSWLCCSAVHIPEMDELKHCSSLWCVFYLFVLKGFRWLNNVRSLRWYNYC